MDRQALMDTLAEYGKSPITKAAQYWAEDNARFEKTNPGLADRVGRALNPMTSFGAAMGAMHDASGRGDKTDMGLALLQALPLFGALRVVASPAQGLLKASTQIVPSLTKTALHGAAGTSASVAVDEAQAYNNPPR